MDKESAWGGGAAGRARTNRNFLIYWGGSFVADCGAWGYRIASALIIWEFTQSGFWIGALAFVEFAPGFILLPLFGAATDQWGARRIAIFALVITALSSMVLTALAAADQLNTNALLAISLFHGFARFLAEPARSVLFAEILRRDDLVAGLALNSVTSAIARFSGPAFVGLMLGRFGFAAAILVGAVAASVFAAAIFYLRLNNPKLETPLRLTQAGKLFGRVRRVKDDRAIGFFIFVLLIPFFLVIPFNQLLAGLVDNVFDRGPGGLATMISVSTAGGILTSVILIFRNRWSGVTRLFIFAVAILAIGFLALASVQLFGWRSLFYLSSTPPKA